jgi:sugar phosphate isomerase/epimerase
MRLGIQENLLPGETFEEKVRKAEEYGFDCIELWGHNLEGRVKEIKDALRGRDLQISTICSGYRGSLLSSEKEQRDIAVKDIKKLLKIGADLGAVGVIVIPIFGPSQIPDLSPFKDAKELEKELLVGLLYSIAEEAVRRNCFCLLEPLKSSRASLRSFRRPGRRSPRKWLPL